MRYTRSAEPRATSKLGELPVTDAADRTDTFVRALTNPETLGLPQMRRTTAGFDP